MAKAKAQARFVEKKYTDEDIRKILLEYVSGDILYKPEDFDEDVSFALMGVDSLDFTQLIMWTEKKFNISIDETEERLNEKTTTFPHFVGVVQRIYKS